MATLLRERLHSGVWEGEFENLSPKDGIQILFQEKPLADVVVGARPDGVCVVRGHLPPDVVSDGVHTLLVQIADGTTIATCTIIAGTAAGQDMRAEINLLRAELDMLKQAFRRHCVETMQ